MDIDFEPMTSRKQQNFCGATTGSQRIAVSPTSGHSSPPSEYCMNRDSQTATSLLEPPMGPKVLSHQRKHLDVAADML